jgi:hypothetical protein
MDTVLIRYEQIMISFANARARRAPTTTTAPFTMKNHLKYATLLLGSALALSACKDDDEVIPPGPVNEEELITALHLFLTPTGGGDTSEFSFSDPDGSGGTGPMYDWDTLPSGTTFIGWVKVYNGSTDITPEVISEGTAHQFFYDVISGGLQWTGYTDVDSNGDPIGVGTMWTTQSSSGELGIKLIHQPDKGAAGVAAGDITNAGGETDVSVGIPYVID